MPNDSQPLVSGGQQPRPGPQTAMAVTAYTQTTYHGSNGIARSTDDVSPFSMAYDVFFSWVLNHNHRDHDHDHDGFTAYIQATTVTTAAPLTFV